MRKKVRGGAKLKVESSRWQGKKDRKGSLVPTVAGAGLGIVGAPTMLIDVVVNEGLRKTGLPFTVESSKFRARFSRRLEPPGFERRRGASVKIIWLDVPPHPRVFAQVGETKGLPENFVDVRETKELASAKAKQRTRLWSDPK
jgi:hypothetical protein